MYIEEQRYTEFHLNVIGVFIVHVKYKNNI